MDSNIFDVIVLGTGLTESIVAAGLAKAGYRLAQLDSNSYYGADDASLTYGELVQWAEEHSNSSETLSTYYHRQREKFTSISCSPSTIPYPRQYSISLSPSIIPSIGPLISSLVSSGVARYGNFRLLERTGIYDSSGTVKPVPGSKEDIFKNKDLSLLEKRRLMRFLSFAVGEFECSKEFIGKEDQPFLDFVRTTFSLNDEIAIAVTYSLAFCASASEPSLPALLRIRRYLRSAGRYGTSSFLVGHYGGSGEIAQGFCRASAVHGGVYILSKTIASIRPISTSNTSTESNYCVKLEDFPDELKCDLLISMADYLPPNLAKAANYVLHDSGCLPTSAARGIAIIDQPIHFNPQNAVSPEPPTSDIRHADQSDFLSQAAPDQEPDTSVIVFPPSSVNGGSPNVSVTTLITGEGTVTTPKGKWIVYILMPLLDLTRVSISAESLLRPYLDAILSLAHPTNPPRPLHTMYYIQQSTPASMSDSSSSIIVTPPPVSLLSECGDAAATNAEAVFWKAIPILEDARQRRRQAKVDNYIPRDAVIETFWPPLYGDEGQTEDGW